MASVTGSKKRQCARRTGGYCMSYIGSLAQTEPERATAEILEAFERSRGRMVSAALELGIDRRHLQRLVWLLGLWPQVDAIRERWRLFLAMSPSLRLVSQPGLTRPSVP